MADLASLSVASEGITLAPQTQARILKQMSQFLDWCVGEGELGANPWEALKVKDRPEVHPHGVLTDDQVSVLLAAKDRVLHSAAALWAPHGHALWGDLWAHGGGHHSKGEPGAVCQHQAQCGETAEVQGRRARGATCMGCLSSCWIPLCQRLAGCSHISLWIKVVKRYAYLRRLHPELHGTVFHSTRKWFITQCERTGVPEHFTATLVGHHSARSANKLTYGLYSAGISDAQKREIVEGVRIPGR